MAVGEALTLDMMKPEPLLAVQEIGQTLAEHGDLAGDRAVGREAEELDGLHGSQR